MFQAQEVKGNEQKELEKREAEDNLNKAQRHGVYRYFKQTGSTRELTIRQDVQRMRLEMYLEAGLECHSKELGDSELLKGFKTGNDMIRYEV